MGIHKEVSAKFQCCRVESGNGTCLLVVLMLACRQCRHLPMGDVKLKLTVFFYFLGRCVPQGGKCRCKNPKNSKMALTPLWLGTPDLQLPDGPKGRRVGSRKKLSRYII